MTIKWDDAAAMHYYYCGPDKVHVKLIDPDGNEVKEDGNDGTAKELVRNRVHDTPGPVAIS
jgi:hypothetical protein